MAIHLIPQEATFFEMLEAQSARLLKPAGSLEGDARTAVDRMIEALDKSFITPFDREDLYTLSEALADVEEARAEGPEAGLDESCDRIDAAIRMLRDLSRNGQALRDLLGAIARGASTAGRDGDDPAAIRALDACRAAGRAIAILVVKGG